MEKKNLLVGIIIILIVFLISVLIVFNNTSKDIEKSNAFIIKNSNFNLVKNNNNFFNIQQNINDYLSKLNGDNYFADYMYEYCFETKCIYLISGLEQKNIFSINENELAFEKHNFKIERDTRKNIFNIETVDIDLDKYLSTFTTRSDFEIVGEFTYRDHIFTEETKLSNYLARYVNYLMYDKERAYNLLTENMKNYYISYENFDLNREYLISNIKTTIFTYYKVKNGSSTVYYITDSELSKINIYEKDIMDFEIEFEIN